MTDGRYVMLERELEALLLRRMVDGLDAEESARLHGLLERVPDVDEERYERLAVLVMLASIETFEPMPDRLRERITANAYEALPAK